MSHSSRHHDDTLPLKGLDLLRQKLVLLVAVAQLARGSIAPAPESAVGGEGKAVHTSRQHSYDALAKGLDLLWLALGLPVTVAKPAMASVAQNPDGAVGWLDSCRSAE